MSGNCPWCGEAVKHDERGGWRCTTCGATHKTGKAQS